jgi:hypothetical protein
MKKLPVKVVRHIHAAHNDLYRCIEHPEEALIHIERARHNTRVAHEWIFAQKLIQESKASQRKRST